MDKPTIISIEPLSRNDTIYSVVKYSYVPTGKEEPINRTVTVPNYTIKEVIKMVNKKPKIDFKRCYKEDVISPAARLISLHAKMALTSAVYLCKAFQDLKRLHELKAQAGAPKPIKIQTEEEAMLEQMDAVLRTMPSIEDVEADKHLDRIDLNDFIKPKKAPKDKVELSDEDKILKALEDMDKGMLS